MGFKPSLINGGWNDVLGQVKFDQRATELLTTSATPDSNSLATAGETTHFH
jgi:hypothetical protein